MNNLDCGMQMFTSTVNRHERNTPDGNSLFRRTLGQIADILPLSRGLTSITGSLKVNSCMLRVWARSRRSLAKRRPQNKTSGSTHQATKHRKRLKTTKQQHALSLQSFNEVSIEGECRCNVLMQRRGRHNGRHPRHPSAPYHRHLFMAERR
jgi:hypothetical protein